jgi:short subunit dehydrogenase-like uncharacterized protein
VGPFALYGSPLVKVCAETGTDYCDSTGELQWIARMIAAHEATAEKSGARLLHCCGFDSVPSDMGVFFLQQQAQARFGEPCQDVRLRVKRLDGGASGGTIASILNLVKEARRDRSLTQLINNPYGLSPTAPVADPREPTAYMPKYDAVSGSWQAPFLMAPTNAQIVHRSNAMLDYAWGRNFAYDEAMMMGSGLGGRMKAYGMSAGLAGLMSTLAFAPTRGLLEKFVVPKPGTGPSPAQQAKGGYDLRFFGKTEKGEMLKTRVTGNLDPGYGSTSRMLGETVACLAKDLPEADRKGGFYTTASLLGDKLLARLQQYAGLGFHLLS